MSLPATNAGDIFTPGPRGDFCNFRGCHVDRDDACRPALDLSLGLPEIHRLLRVVAVRDHALTVGRPLRAAQVAVWSVMRFTPEPSG